MPDLLGYPDRAIIRPMVYSFARVGAAMKMEVKDYYEMVMTSASVKSGRALLERRQRA